MADMPNTIKLMCFSLIGTFIFLILSLFLPVLVVVSTGFTLIAALSLDIYWFQLIETKHHFLKLGVSFGTLCLFLGIMKVAVNTLGINKFKDMILLVTVNDYILNYGISFGMFFTVASLVVYIFESLFQKPIELSDERDSIFIRIFRIGMYCTFAIGYCFVLFGIEFAEFSALQKIVQLFLIFVYIYDIVSIALVMINDTYVSKNFKLIYLNVIYIILSIIFYVATLYVRWSNGTTMEIVSIKDISDMKDIYIIVCHIFILLLLVQFFINMIIRMFYVKKKTVLYYFYPVFLASGGLILSGGICYLAYSWRNFDYFNLMIVYDFLTMYDVYYVLMFVFAVSVGICFMNVAYRMLFGSKSITSVK